ncbi:MULTISPECIES: hypothetical protein [unclassified Bradyrhizobium]|uniref:hypothetical protein n=1 Tax=unclassified Bradyrhizobium TaxID=2631580 RepID=UPI00247A2AF6|nr:MULTISPECIES: hypothetical protein [unclassified Bradyrhizobium]WGR68167.1 hypothetical protein MTX24_22230 [Bradyrhizobium sp. ISRA426]WGR80222.1 hypothetical protein MTX21_07345 [Bradyrhizobium sp. ISRA430]WGR83407.1 hypothetical protein MTX25_21910 [Bradyrhizobium sp. ISRA432]
MSFATAQRCTDHVGRNVAAKFPRSNPLCSDFRRRRPPQEPRNEKGINSYFTRGDQKCQAGASLLGGLVTQDELNNLSIPHALGIELDTHQLAAATGPNHAGQFTFPAVSADGDSAASYTGTIPMGAHFALPPNIDLAAAGLTPEGLALAKAYQTYGGYVVDMAGHTTALAQVEATPEQQATCLPISTGYATTSS